MRKSENGSLEESNVICNVLRTCNKFIVLFFNTLFFTGVPVQSFVGCKPKMYSILLSDKNEKRTAKGISKSVIKNQFHHAMYKNSLMQKTLCKRNELDM